MKSRAWLFPLAFFSIASVHAAQPEKPNDFRQLTEVRPLPVALDPSFEFRKTKLFFLGDPPATTGGKAARASTSGRAASRDPTVAFESSYRLYGAVTVLDQRRRWGHYFDFFWRSAKAVPVTVRLEYRPEKLRTFTQAREVNYVNGKGSHRTSYAVIGDDFFNDGRILSWRCLLIADGRIVAEDRSYLWR